MTIYKDEIQDEIEAQRTVADHIKLQAKTMREWMEGEETHAFSTAIQGALWDVLDAVETRHDMIDYHIKSALADIHRAQESDEIAETEQQP